MAPPTTVTVRMYNVGFGDSFLVTVKRAKKSWRMLVDCGVHAQGHIEIGGRKRTIGDVVAAIIDDLGPNPRLDVVVATHHHADHISGFADDAWSGVEVGEVWVPFVEDPKDPDGKVLRHSLTQAADTLRSLIAEARSGPRSWASTLQLADVLAANSSGNARATDRLLGRGGVGFANTPKIRYLPSTHPQLNVIDTALEQVLVHVVGPSRDPNQLKRMEPPKAVRWLQADSERRALLADASGHPPALFDPDFVVADGSPADVPDRLRTALASANDADALLAAASLLERSVNNTSVFFVLDVLGTRLLFVGDAQHGAWEHVLADDTTRELVTDVDFYKIGHHGSHNATPRRFVEEVIGTDAWAMLPWGEVKQWGDIPKTTMLAALDKRDVRVIRADAPIKGKGVRYDKTNQMWSELTLEVN